MKMKNLGGGEEQRLSRARPSAYPQIFPQHRTAHRRMVKTYKREPAGLGRCLQGRGRRGLTSYRQVCRGPFLLAEALLAQVKDDNAADGGPVRPASVRALVN